MFAGIFAAALIWTAPLPPERRVLLPMDYRGVRITDGLLKRQLDDAKDFYLRIPNDDLLLGFRRRAGKPAPGVELGGWYSTDTFHIFGQILSGLSRMYAATGDPACKGKGVALYEGWRACIAPDGYFYYSTKSNAPHYVFDKMAGGLIDVAIYLGRRDALDSLDKITRWAERHLDRTRRYGADSSEWYTLSENLNRAYLLTGDTRYREFAKVWEYTPYWQLYARNQSIFSVADWIGKPAGSQLSPPGKLSNIGYHAYSHVNTLGGAALAYRVSGEGRYLDIIRNAYDFMHRDEWFATGGYGPDESLLQKDELERRLEDTSATFETQCGTWAIFKLCKNLIALTGDAKYGDWVERAAYNGIGATIPETPDGKVLYYSNYNPFGAAKLNHWDGWSCCAGTRPMAIADVDDLIYFRAQDGLNINLFVPSVAKIRAGTIEQITRFPEQPVTELRLHLNHRASFALRFRHAEWFQGAPTGTVNGRTVPFIEDKRHWFVLKRAWCDGDDVRINLPMGLRAAPFTANRYPTAIMNGPVVLAFRGVTNPANKLDLAQLSSQLIPSSGEPLTFHLRSAPSVLARPFYAFKEGEPYFMYLDPKAVGRVPYWSMRKEGVWHNSGKFWFSNQPGAWCEVDFEGDDVRIIGWRFDDGGHAQVTVDGKPAGQIDQYGPGRDLPFDYRLTGLGAGRHTIRITVLSDKDPASNDRYINVGGLLEPVGKRVEN